eukprot:jgi/Tetstr1/444150/TSEL_032046.t1
MQPCPAPTTEAAPIPAPGGAYPASREASGFWRDLDRDWPAVARAEGVAAAHAEDPWRYDELRDGGGFPRRDGTLDPGTLVADLPPGLKARVWRHAREALPRHRAPAAALAHLEAWEPAAARVKEVLESLEAFRLVEAFLITARKRHLPAIDTVYDVACGHGIVGVLLALRFPALRVVCCDTLRRPAFDAWVAALTAASGPPGNKGHRSPAPALPPTPCSSGGGSGDPKPPLHAAQAAPSPLANVEFLHADLADLVPTPSTLVLAIHACGGANTAAIGAAAAAGAPWAAMPCCMRAEDYLPGVSVSRLPNSQRYAMLCGAMAARYGAQMVRAIDERITDRNILLAGGINSSGGGTDGEGVAAADGLDGPQKLRFMTVNAQPTPRDGGAPRG